MVTSGWSEICQKAKDRDVQIHFSRLDVEQTVKRLTQQEITLKPYHYFFFVCIPALPLPPPLSLSLSLTHTHTLSVSPSHLVFFYVFSVCLATRFSLSPPPHFLSIGFSLSLAHEHSSFFF